MKTTLRRFLLAACIVAAAIWFVAGVSTRVQLASAPGDYVLVDAKFDVIATNYQDVLQKGLEYLAKAQRDDGHCEGDGGQYPVAMTSMAALALLMERERGDSTSLKDYKFGDQLRKARDWLVGQQRESGLIYSDHPSESNHYMEGHGLATIFLAGLYEGPGLHSLAHSVNAIFKARSTQGGWHHTSTMEGHDFDDVTTTAIQLQALQAAAFATIRVPANFRHDAEVYLMKSLTEPLKDRDASGRRRTEVAAALASRGTYWFSSDPTVSSPVPKWREYCKVEIPLGNHMNLGRDELTHYFYAQGLFNQTVSRDWGRSDATSAWIEYCKATFEKLRVAQNKDGSWPGGNGLGVGPIYSTAVWCTVLQLDKNRHPSCRVYEAYK